MPILPTLQLGSRGKEVSYARGILQFLCKSEQCSSVAPRFREIKDFRRPEPEAVFDFSLLDLVKTFRNKYRFPGQPMIDQVLWYQMFHVLMNDHLYTPHLAALDFDSPFPQAFNCISTGPFALSIPIFLSRYFQVVANPQGYKNLTESGKNGLTYLLDRIDNDDRVSDIRHAAYILSTAFAESRDWRKSTFSEWNPVREVGLGHDPSKPERPENYDHTFFLAVNSSAQTVRSLHHEKIMSPGSDLWRESAEKIKENMLKKTPNILQSGEILIYEVYYGRGYVQITHWFNYEKIGKTLGLGVDLVVNPDLVLSRDVAYEVMIRGMNEGLFTGKKLSDYINGNQCDYKNARRIINKLNECDAFATRAKNIESLLRASSVTF